MCTGIRLSTREIRRVSIFLLLQRMSLRDWSLIKGRGVTKREGGEVNFYPYEKKGGGRKKF